MTREKISTKLLKPVIDDLDRVIEEKNTILRNCDSDIELTREDVMRIALYKYINDWDELKA